MGHLVSKRVSRVWLYYDWVYNLLYWNQVKRVENILSDLKAEYEQFIKEVIEQKQSEETSSDDHQPNFTDLYYANPDDETEDHTWWDEVATILAAASDGVVSAVSFFLLTLANYPEVQAKVHNEIRYVMGDSNRDITAEDIESLTYLDQVLMESMRLHGVIATVFRKATKDIKLKNITLPAGSRIALPLLAYGWNPVHFPEPQEFQPDRFSPEKRNARHKYAFLPFSGGPRNCIGQKYASYLMKTIIIHILRKFQIKSQVRLEDVEYEIKVVIFSKHPLPIEFIPV